MRRALHWWREEIAKARKIVGRTWRALSRARKRGRLVEAEALRARLRAEKATLKKPICLAKKKAWADFLATLDSDL